MKASELSGALLDEWVARAEGHAVERRFRAEANCQVTMIVRDHGTRGVPHFSSNWTHGGPIIERECIDLQAFGMGSWAATHCNDQMVVSRISGTTPLVAAMRAYIATKFGEEISI